jgi:hypothetical protein
VRVLSARLTVYDVVETGEILELPVKGELKDILGPDRVCIIVDDDDRKIWLWKGVEAGVRKKFIAARRGQEVRSMRGLVFKVMSIDQGEEPDAFLALLGMKVPTSKPKPEVEVKVELPDRTIEIAPDELPPPMPKSEPKPPKPSKPKVKPKPATPSPAVAPVATTDLGAEYNGAEQQWHEGATLSRGTAPAQNDIIGKVQDIQPPAGYSRELVIIGHEIFTTVDRTVSFLGKSKSSTQLERTRTLPDGPFFGGEYTPRILVENGRVLATEFLKKVEAISTSLREATQDADVSELIDIFRITTDSDEKSKPTKKKKAKKKKKK